MTEKTVDALNFIDIKEGMTFEQSYQITKEVYQGFIDAFGDENQLHTDDQYAQKKGFQGKVMQGAIVNGFISHFIGMVFPLANTVIQAVDVDYKKPSYLDDQLNFITVVEQKSEAVQTIVLKISVQNATQDWISAKARVQIGILEDQS